jgi:hypothetical protein
MKMAKESDAKWQKPELVVLVRNKSEEAVLAACKGGTGSSTPGYTQGTCQPNTACNICSSTSSS